MGSDTDRSSRGSILPTALQFAQLVVLCIAVATAALAIGGRNADLATATAQITELRSICADLARVVGSLSTTDATHTAQLASIEKRLDRLEFAR